MRKSKGFTLIELLIVIAIIGILAAVLIPNLLNARNLAQDRAAQAYGAQVFTAVNAWLAADPANRLGTGAGATTPPTCGRGHVFTLGAFSVPDPGVAVTACEVSGTAATVGVSVASPRVVFNFGIVANPVVPAP